MSDAYDIIVLGGGAVGEVAAQFAIAGSNLTAAIVESELLGGECSYWACMPSKALLRPIAVASTGRNLPGVASSAGIDTSALLDRRDAWVSHYCDDRQREWAATTMIDVISGRGRISGEKTVVVGNRTRSARHAVVVATGSTAAVPEVFAGLAPWTSRDATGVRDVPQSLVIVGGGAVACEAATWMAALGSKVTMLVRSTLLSDLDSFVGEKVEQALVAAGVDVRIRTNVIAAQRDSVAEDLQVGRSHGGTVRVQTNAGDVVAEEILIATGRHRSVDDIGLGSVGITDPSDLSSVDWLYSVGDASFSPMLTHWGKYQSRIVGQRISAIAAGRAPAPQRDDIPVPQVVFTDPQVAHTGLSAAQADNDDRDVTVINRPITSAAGISLLRDDATGTAQIVVDNSSRMLVGATFVGPDAGDLIHAATVAVVGKVTVDDLWYVVPSYPTSAEVIQRLVEGYFGY